MNSHTDSATEVAIEDIYSKHFYFNNEFEKKRTLAECKARGKLLLKS